jgi:hypothetical protein
MRNWKTCYGTKPNNNKLLQHQTSFQHAQSVAAHVHYLDIKSGKFQSVAELQEAEHAKQIKDNRHYLRTIAEILLVTAQQKIAQRETGRSFRVKDIKRKSLMFGQLFFPLLPDMTQLLLKEFDTALQMQNTSITPSRKLR